MLDEVKNGKILLTDEQGIDTDILDRNNSKISSREF